MRPLTSYPMFIPVEADTVLTPEQESRVFGNERLFHLELQRIGKAALTSPIPDDSNSTREIAHAEN